MSTGIVSPMLVVETQAVEVGDVMGGHLMCPYHCGQNKVYDTGFLYLHKQLIHVSTNILNFVLLFCYVHVHWRFGSELK